MLVGGCVRDELMGARPKDWDLEVYGVEPLKLKEILVEFASSLAAAGGRQDAGVPLNIVGEAFTVYKSAAIWMCRCRGVSRKWGRDTAGLSSKAILGCRSRTRHGGVILLSTR